MKHKDSYLGHLSSPGVPFAQFNAAGFLHDITEYADSKFNGSIKEALYEFLHDKKLGIFDKIDCGTFALYALKERNLVSATVLLINALALDEEDAKEGNILVEYMGMKYSEESGGWALSWEIDHAMNWPIGTICPNSKFLWDTARLLIEKQRHSSGVEDEPSEDGSYMLQEASDLADLQTG